jgi:hypothetical protein
LTGPGRPRSPYGGSDPRWQPGGTTGWLAPAPDLELFVERKVTRPDARWFASVLLHRLGVPVLRRVLETMLVFDHGFEPRDVTNSLRKLSGHRYDEYTVIGETHRFSGEDNHVYCMGRAPRPAELRQLEILYERRSRLLTSDLLRRAGEKHARDLLIASERFSGITQMRRLGTVIVKGKPSQLSDNETPRTHSLDVCATDEKSGLRYGISVKNERQWLYAGDGHARQGHPNKAIKDIFTKAHAHGLRPWLIVPFASENARRRCRDDGIRLTVLGYRVLPIETPHGAKMRAAIRDLRAVIGPEPFEYMGSRLVISDSVRAVLAELGSRGA